MIDPKRQQRHGQSLANCRKPLRMTCAATPLRVCLLFASLFSRIVSSSGSQSECAQGSGLAFDLHGTQQPETPRAPDTQGLGPGRRRGSRRSLPANRCDCQEPNTQCSQHFDALLPTAPPSKAAQTHRKGLASRGPHHHTNLRLSETRRVAFTRARALTDPHRQFNAILMVQQWLASRCSAPLQMERQALSAQR